ncbi:MAG: SIR2 family protein [Saprospiraceae bacterium]|nr:SIR2 family protein [Saprospiraceae bacterium]
MLSATVSPAQIAWKDILRALRDQKCVLLLGPDLLPDENCFLSLCQHLGIDFADLPGSLPRDVAMVYPKDELFLFPNDAARTRTWRRFEEFYDDWQHRVAPMYASIAALPFPVVISTLPDLGLRRVFEQRGILHQFSYYDYAGTPEPHDRISASPRDTRLVFNMFGILSDHNSLVLTHEDLFRFFCQILGDKKLTSDLYIELSQTLKYATDFIFVGFQFDQWPMQMLLRLLNPERNKGRQYALNPAVAEETRVFFADQFEVEFVGEITPAQFLDELAARWDAEEQQRADAGAPLQQTLRDWLKQGHLARILEKLEGTPAAQDAAFQLGRLSELRRSIHEGVVSSDNAQLEMNKIRKAVQHLIEGLT